MIRKILLIFFVSLWYISCGKSTPSEENGLLWKVSGNGLKHSSYLFGTWHGTNAIGANFLDSIPGFYDAFNSVKQYTGEMVWSEEINAVTEEFYSNLLGEKWIPSDSTYADLLPEKDLQYLDSVLLQCIHCKSDQVNVTPNYLSLIVLKIEGEKSTSKGSEAFAGETMDPFLIKLAQEKGYEVKGLDSPDIYRRILVAMHGKDTSSTISLKESAIFLVSALKSIQYTPDSIINSLKSMEDAYRNFDLEGVAQEKNKGLQEIIFGAEYSLGFDYDFLLNGRNKEWMKQIPGLISGQPTLIGVGAMHLVGETGLINQLRKLGYTVKPVK